MKKSLRQEKLYNYLLSLNQAVAVAVLAEHFACSLKTIRRDIEELAECKKSPWYIFENKVYIDQEQKKRFQIEDNWLSSEELNGLIALYHSVDNLSNGALQGLLNPVKERIIGAISQQQSANKLPKSPIKIIEIANRQLDPQLFQQLHRCIAQRTVITVLYWKRSDDQQQIRTLSPQQLVRYKDNWYVDAYCHQVNDLRSFALDAIIKVTESLPSQYRQIEPREIDRHFQQSYGIFSGQATQTASLHFDEYITRWVEHEIWHPQQISEKQPDGSLIMHLPYHHDIELIQDILKHGSNVKVLAPQDLKDKVKQRLAQAWEAYQSE
ncbi:transcriptional regulator [Thiosulfatimonas sediminis]|uniref:Transcriptional regulator n=1 Tax=Thiosulfatimonas sediminis TaxID=2675054 RepID=A0A6F8PWC6_9GAMM|nr:WYL domain-containing protein [Thiosulfatimonas sediminis]BBP46419.1 transcriptional regulator [Thiosulfatimonas sediminis]